jgi:hypothetical protein
MAESTDGARDGAASEIKDQMGQSASDMASTVREKAREQIDQRSSDAGERVGSLAGDLRQLSEQLREQGNNGPAKLGEEAAQRTERVGSYLSESGPDTILRDIEDLGRRQPWLALAGGVVLGIAAARALKASSSDRFREQSANGGSAGSNGAAATGAAPTSSSRPDVPPPVGNLTETMPVSYGDSATAQAAAEDFSDRPAGGAPDGGSPAR